MATVLAFTSPALGHLFPMTPLLLELHARGHRVHLRTLGSQVGAMRALGLEASALDPRALEIVHPDWEAKDPVGALKLAVRTFTQRADVDAPDFQSALDEVAPDLVIVDITAWGALAVAERWGGPWVTHSPFTPPITSKGTPPFGPGLRPIPGPIGRLRDALVRPLVMGAAERTLRPGINAVRERIGVPPVHGADDFFRRCDLMLVTTSEPFEYAHPDWAPQVQMIGANAWEPPQALPAWLDEITDPIVLVTTSSEFQDDGLLVRTALEALRDEPVHVVATMPAGVDATIKVPANATLVEFVPHGPVLDRAVVAVTHGGMGATQKALARGIPVCVVPFGRDQLEVARRAEVSGSGTRLPAKKLNAERLRAKVKEAMTLTSGAQRVKAGYAVAGGAPAGADAVEGLLKKGAPA
ncbi:glycosyl transferase [Knoellia sinensis KCTC 19936]|uniref:Glycosyl transferase n=1 Tax=Knoellia sinensis KCTC 19936 TaxID=1385520 RepID=A0A0A0J0H4_9MICO|nr:glycosyltransferase [Knoellia sinensis]KGN30548.1 glycosyl transferase [Knoellia sinensis KCTC 19936]